MVNEQTISVWDVINIVASILGIISAGVTIFAAFRTKRYAKSIVQAYSAESLVLANEKLDQAKDLFLKLRAIEYGQARGASPQKTQEELSKIESLLDEAEKKTPSDKSYLKNAINDCKKTLDKCVRRSTEQKVFTFLGTDLDNARNHYQAEIDKERTETIKNLK